MNSVGADNGQMTFFNYSPPRSSRVGKYSCRICGAHLIGTHWGVTSAPPMAASAAT